MKTFWSVPVIKPVILAVELNKNFAITCLTCWLFIPLNSWYLRPWIYKSHIEEYGILGSIPSFLFVVVVTLFFWTLVQYKYYQKMILLMSLVIGFAYELMQKDLIPGHTFDPGDLVATALAALVLFPMIKK